jgi:hypothetical protein
LSLVLAFLIHNKINSEGKCHGKFSSIWYTRK